MTTEQETGKGTPGRRAVPKTGTRRSATGHQPKPRPRPDTRHEPEAKRSAAERARAEAAGRRPADERARADADGTAPAAGRARGGAGGREAAGQARGAASREAAGRVREAAGREAAGRVREAAGRETGERAREAAGRETPADERVRGTGRRTPVVERVRGQAAARRPLGGRARAEAAPGRPAPRRGPARRQRAPFVLLVVGLLCGGLVSLLLLNTMLAQDAITDATLRKEIAEARLQNEQIDQEYQRKTQPGVIADLAEKQGYDRDWSEVDSWSSAGDQASRVDTER
ncbi:regulator of extracellular matrix RemA (YlzA/DUF370 family) [Nonomuraea thailandensis]|uniref:Regulator of extracellular matrix RemA (YlzA/DUF370 family) n=3 Tax=Nonomuraea thailandensis TaxID=1188745 RepID=A0A9X2GIH1_9ACTN|nr:hypothetical protein [Nonomuraea thailandensis]MCP2359481.1 regulator of extracellular matrix RemA (YlzA/DUF370 family) [Nonomuraea thailandensis]